MQSPVLTRDVSENIPWYKTRTVISGLFLIALGVLYFVLVLPVAQAEVPPSNYRWPFSFITLIYAVDLAILAIDFFYKLAKPSKTPVAPTKVGKSDVLGMVLRGAFMLVLGGSYLTGAMVSTPTVFSPLAPTWLVGLSVPIFADYLHSLFASLIIGFGIAIVVFEVVKILLHKSTWRNWLVTARYREIKVLYWIIAISVIAQGILGLFLLGTVTPLGPFALVGPNSYQFETLIRHIHGPMGALIFALFSDAIYFRLRPEFSIK
ncbi:MAG: hypothetical protein JRN20_11575 [Nitrososphaerota archaeon]|nr:hypothetical protein [Nitrososphaerota archaeon]